MKVLGWTAALILVGWTGNASADPDKDESGNGRWRGGYERNYDYPGRGAGYERPRRERRAFKQEYDDGRCKYERKLERSGEYKEEVKCRGGRAPRRATYGYQPYPSYGYRY
jgi:hypothetical protein